MEGDQEAGGGGDRVRGEATGVGNCSRGPCVSAFYLTQFG